MSDALFTHVIYNPLFIHLKWSQLLLIRVRFGVVLQFELDIIRLRKLIVLLVEFTIIIS